MTTPERFRRRQRVEGTALIILGVFTVLISIYFRGQDSAQRACINAYISAQAETSAIRSKIVERESTATRRIISSALTAQTQEDIINARERYFRSLRAIDRVRDENPVRAFPEGVCG